PAVRASPPKREKPKPASAFRLKRLGRKGQQIRCNSEADGQSPDERERWRGPALPASGVAGPCALILVPTGGHESDVTRRRNQRFRNITAAAAAAGASALRQAAARGLRAIRVASRGGRGVSQRLHCRSRGAAYSACGD